MSEYQYYEFLAIDRPLTAEEISALRSLSTRAHITPVSFINEYNWGNFRGNPDDLMRRFFDAHVYVANWMTAIFMVRLTIEAIPKAIADAVALDDILELEASNTHWMVTWRLDDSENYDRFGMDDGRGWMARLAPIRDELLRGDFRSFYIGWLSAVTRDMIDEDDLEPLTVEGMGSLTGAQKALAEFLEVDEDLLEGAGTGNPERTEEAISQKEIDNWLGELPRNEVLVFMKQLLEGQSLKAERDLKNRFSAWQRSLKGKSDPAPRRSIKELKKNATAAEKKRLERKKKEQEQREIKRRKEREAYLASLTKDFPKAWKMAEQLAARGSGSGYDEACRLLVDISEAYALHANKGDFGRKLKQFMASHLQRKALIQRLLKAGIWRENEL